jgi:hypothetical protein
MSDTAIELRRKAARKLRRMRQIPRSVEQDKLRREAEGYKQLAENEEWLSGQRPKTRRNGKVRGSAP